MTRPDLSALEALKELHKTIAEELHEDPETWPDHGNAPLAIAAAFMLVKLRAERAEAERDQLRGMLNLVMAIPTMTDAQLEQLRQNALSARAKVVLP